ncbi:uncharacterized protein LOC126893842 [Daktulosphaira vitifoliae]|uniref:uncharacterized protein LOC126893842 n=1 Tax=Daktulosphaira vitifoliae TaxID=58002 RepID=UPI0021AA3AA7|nr:uncharacterized protein LOC126893842 [Daktulosphaira vitifoliae]XP_050520323.1 uncharacterized protein LOC126893842 [Daktulosphaira vitifoliae]XP_050520324.1 uncharacterized protein LOC126893842 [Daktulosphaira vitifoliae]
MKVYFLILLVTYVEISAAAGMFDTDKCTKCQRRERYLSNNECEECVLKECSPTDKCLMCENKALPKMDWCSRCKNKPKFYCVQCKNVLHISNNMDVCAQCLSQYVFEPKIIR